MLPYTATTCVPQVLILLYMCPHTTVYHASGAAAGGLLGYAALYYYYMCPHATHTSIYVSSYYCISRSWSCSGRSTRLCCLVFRLYAALKAAWRMLKQHTLCVLIRTWCVLIRMCMQRSKLPGACLRSIRVLTCADVCSAQCCLAHA